MQQSVYWRNWALVCESLENAAEQYHIERQRRMAEG
jgi:hypothetical protein